MLAYKEYSRRLTHDERTFEKRAKADVRFSVKELKGMLHKLNRFVYGHDGGQPGMSSYYESLFRNASEMFSDMVGRLIKEQKSNIMKRFCTVKPYFARRPFLFDENKKSRPGCWPVAALCVSSVHKK